VAAFRSPISKIKSCEDAIPVFLRSISFSSPITIRPILSRPWSPWPYIYNPAEICFAQGIDPLGIPNRYGPVNFIGSWLAVVVEAEWTCANNWIISPNAVSDCLVWRDSFYQMWYKQN
jgi:hypothetical protein